MVKNGIRLIGLLGLLAACLSCSGGATVIAYKQGRRAEAKRDWDTALVDYEKARTADRRTPCTFCTNRMRGHKPV